MVFPKLFKKEKRAEARPGERAPAVGARAAPAPPEGEPLDSAQGKRRMVGVLIAPHQTEKAVAAARQGWYTFRVAPQANKIMVGQAVEERYGVAVERVSIIHQRPKKIRRGKIWGEIPGFKKALVKVKAGQSIEFT